VYVFQARGNTLTVELSYIDFRQNLSKDTRTSIDGHVRKATRKMNETKLEYEWLVRI